MTDASRSLTLPFFPNLKQWWELLLMNKPVLSSFTTDEAQYYSKLDSTFNDKVKREVNHWTASKNSGGKSGSVQT